MRLPFVVLSCGFGAFLCAADFVVPSGTTETTTQTLSNADDEGLIQEGGAIVVVNLNGVAMNGANQSVLNAGTIRSTGDTTRGIRSQANSSTIVNSGTISVTGTDSNSLLLLNSSAKIVNSGTIAATGSNCRAILFEGASSILVNSGTISASDTGGIAVYSENATNSLVVINSGTIKGPTALRLTGTNPTLSLLLGSNIQGVVFSDLALNLNVQEGLNLRLTIEENNGFGRLNIGSPYVTVGNTETIAVVDKTGFTMQADVLEDLSDSVLDSIYRGKYDYLHCCDLHCGGWVEAIGSKRTRKQTIYYDNWEAGGLAGVNWEGFSCGTWGVFAGGTYGEATVGEQKTQEAKVSTGLAGVSYEQMYRNMFVGFAMTAGYVNWDNSRTVMYNLAPNGTQEADANVNGWMISPEVTASGWLCLSRKWSLLTTGTLRYAGMFLGSYSESGSSANLSVSGRQVDLLKVMGELALSGGKGCCWNFEPYIGVAGRFQVGGREVDGELLGQSLSFGSGSPYNLVEVLYGIRGQANMKCYTLYGNVEGLWDNYYGERVLGELGVRYCF